MLEKSGQAKVTAVLRSKFDIVNEQGWDIESVDHGRLKNWKPVEVSSRNMWFQPLSSIQRTSPDRSTNLVVPTIQDAVFGPSQSTKFGSFALPTGASTPYEPAKERYDYIVICTKQLPEKYGLATMVAPLVTPGLTSIILIQNGLNIYLPFVFRFPNQRHHVRSLHDWLLHRRTQ